MKLESAGQVPLPIEFLREPDRNFELGGRSFYFFDFDDNVIHLPTKIVLFHREGQEKHVSTTDFAWIAPLIGKEGTEWKDFEIRGDPIAGTFQNFREQPHLPLNKQPLILDMQKALKESFLDWRGPSWDIFVHAVNNNRPIGVITARGHHPHTIRRAIDTLVLSRDLAASPNYLSIYPVSHEETRLKLGDIEGTWSTAQLKRAAIKAAVRDAFECYGENLFHRFGMSDDDPANVAVIREAMLEIKESCKENAFFVINTKDRQVIKEEIVLESDDKKVQAEAVVSDQIPLFLQ